LPPGQAGTTTWDYTVKRSAFVSRTRYLDLDDRSEDLRELMRQRNRDAHDFMAKFELGWLWHEQALEGVVLSHSELRQAFDPGVIVDSSMVHVFREIRNQRDAIEFIKAESRGRVVKYTLALAKKLYEMLYAGIPNRMPMNFRRDMPLHRTYFHDIVQPPLIQPGLDQLFEFMGSADFKAWHPLKQATHTHHRFMELFPFSDQSGKVGRLMMNLILIRNGYMPVIIHSSDRQKYYEALRLPATQFGHVILDAMDNGIDNAFKYFIPSYDDTARRRAASE
jgi:Fic family protein